MKLQARILIAVLVAILFLPGTTLAGVYPQRAVHVIVPFPPGGSNDIVARVVFQKLAEMTQQPFVIENHGGASGTIGAAIAAKSRPDGYTVMVHSITLLSNAYLRKLPYDPIKDFIGVTPLARQVFVLVVHPSMPVKSVRGFIDLAKKRPGEILFSTGGKGTPLHLAMALFESMTKTKMVQVPYKGGAAAVLSVVAGETQAMTGNLGVLLPAIRAKQVRPLGVTSPHRVEQAPDIPPIAETVPGYDFTAWVGCFVPAGTPATIVDALNADLRKVLADPAVASKLRRQVLDPMYLTPAAYAKLLRSTYETYGKLIKETGAKNR